MTERIVTLIATLACGLLASAGCADKTSSGVSKVDYAGIRVLAGMYRGYLRDNQGKPPADEAAFRAYAEGLAAEFAGELPLDKVFASPRTGRPLVVVAGRRPPAGPVGMSYIAYEAEPVEGKRLVITDRGAFEDLDESQFETLFAQKASKR
ncbi:MAG: hypothetical protein KDA61_19125 [Planctomycetales bacterium]|nr:hypothetical protein [Planctomycetales bacterium]